MGKLIVFNSVTLDGYFTDAHGGMSFAHRDIDDPEWSDFVSGNAQGGGVLVFGRITYDLMASYWPTPMAMKNEPIVAERMNNLPKIVFSRTMGSAAWSNTRLVKSDPAGEIRKLKKSSTEGMAIMGSGSIVSQVAHEGLVDEFQIVIVPVVIGKGRTMFEGVTRTLSLRLISTRAFQNGNVVLSYEPKT